MKKSILTALIASLTVGISSTTFAATNPFSDVPAGHWAYNSVTKLAAEGVIEGYGDGTFLGNRNITRYEMAQMIAKEKLWLKIQAERLKPNLINWLPSFAVNLTV